MKCSNCGNEVSDGALFCSRCGRKLQEENTDENVKQEKYYRVSKDAVICILVFLFFLLGSGAAYVSSHNTKQQGETGQASGQSSEQVPETTAEFEAENVEDEEQELFFDTLSWIKENPDELILLDYTVQKYKPNPRDVTLKWDSELFYRLEDTEPDNPSDGQLVYDTLSKYRFRNKATLNEVEVEVYRDSETADIHKIVAIEHYENYLEVAEYYFEFGKLNFVFVSLFDVYIPTYATLDKLGERFYFQNDVMVKYRKVEEAYEKQDYEIAELDSYDMAVKKAWDEQESSVLNKAYLLYHLVENIPQIGYITGYVYDEENNPLKGIDVQVKSLHYNTEVCEGSTDENGCYQFKVPMDDGGNFEICIRSGEKEAYIYDIIVDSRTEIYYAENMYLSLDETCICDMEILLCDAFHLGESSDSYSQMTRLNNAILIIREGIHNKSGKVVEECTSDENGYVYVKLPAGCYTGEIRKEGYETSYFTIIVKPDNLFVQSLTSPTLKDEEIRIVLSWDAIPSDLDAHLFTPYQGENGEMQHIGYYERNDEYGNNLDVDDMDGYGPETITITDLSEGVYKYYVTDFSECQQKAYDSYSMSESGATVTIYGSRGQLASFHVPPNRQGVIWEVFEIRNKQIIPIQRYYTNVDSKEWWQGNRSTESKSQGTDEGIWVSGRLEKRHHSADANLGGTDYDYYMLVCSNPVELEVMDIEEGGYTDTFDELLLAYDEEMDNYVGRQVVCEVKKAWLNINQGPTTGTHYQHVVVQIENLALNISEGDNSDVRDFKCNVAQYLGYEEEGEERIFAIWYVTPVRNVSMYDRKGNVHTVDSVENVQLIFAPDVYDEMMKRCGEIVIAQGTMYKTTDEPYKYDVYMAVDETW